MKQKTYSDVQTHVFDLKSFVKDQHATSEILKKD